MVNYNDDHMLFQLFRLQQTFKNCTLLLKWVNLNNWIKTFSQFTWFVKLCSIGTFTIHLKANMIFSGWRKFLTWSMSYFPVLTLQWIRSKKIRSLGAVTLWLFFWSFKMTRHRHKQKYLKSTCVLCMGWVHFQFEW